MNKQATSPYTIRKSSLIILVNYYHENEIQEGLPGKKLHELQKQWKADTAAIVEEAKLKIAKQAKAELARQSVRDMALAEKRMEEALAKQQAMYERRLAAKDLELQEQRNLVMALTRSSAGSYPK